MAHINLLPWREAQRARLKQQYLLILAIIAGFTLLVVMGISMWLGQMQENQRERNQYLQAEILNLDIQIREIREIKEQKQKLLTRIDVIRQLQQQRHVPVQVMNELARVMVPGVYLTQVSVNGSAVSIQGYCDSNNHLASMMRQVESARWLSEPKVHQIIASDNSELRENAFKLDMVVLPLGDGPLEAEDELAAIARGR
ncbi:PilN domain-containing protein [uncultured Ferrimonas sp.]|uniref:PilN domain-containing protein n=1 Tax=uncultured Ferrimonas sp. TaxID=432640 RepID=UPI0026079EEF|nr:PilN domain-containing protein [uncultured Ferrimonas sp.]